MHRHRILHFGALIVLLSASVFISGCRQSAQSLVPASPGDGFYWDYLLYVPGQVSSDCLYVIPNNTGEVSDDIDVHRQAARSLMDRKRPEADELGAPLLIPVFPREERIGHIYTHALDRDCLITREENISRLDRQLVAMVDDARTRLEKRGITLGPQVLLSGFSASGMFVNRFVLLQPERVRAAAVGSPGGWPAVPVEEYGGTPLPYPLGIADVEALTGAPVNLAAYKKVPQLYYLGDADDNDAAETCYYEDMRRLTADAFGGSPAERFLRAQTFFESADAKAEFVLYSDVGHALTDQMQADALTFLAQYAC